ncbi:uncharacterized protein LOC127009478 isoform X2 [Eriocheir sinensis]|uniref:uncharacterized protein LOC127009478 isoform X2 n=1 Tax=Eriocheir sinensis TaxID=95602 RepID=UPI0021C92182|nr:uncharacterized protein LOC127009478 isoform X2 [Eriocheir sinensis]
MWTLQRPSNKEPDRKWRLNKGNKYSSLLRFNKKNKENEAVDTVINYRTVDRLHDRVSDRFIDPRADPRLLVAPRGDPRAEGRVIPAPRVDPRLDSRLESRLQQLDQEVEATVGPKGELKGDLKEPEPRPRSDPETRLPRVLPRIEAPPRLREPSRERGVDLKEKLETRNSGGGSGGRQEVESKERYVERYLELLSRDEPDSCGPGPCVEMVSRRKILGRSQDNLNLDLPYQEEEEDVWYKMDKLYKDHIQEVLMKWEQIDDEIWSKVIVFERNRRVAKAYARAPVLTVNGSDDGFDGYRIGLCGFENPMRDPRTEEIRRHIGHGVKVKMDDQGNILIKRVSKAGVYVKVGSDDNAVSNEILKMPNYGLETDKPVMLFDINKFQQNVKREMRRQYPDRSKLESQCVCVIAFVKNEQDLLDCPIWVMIINIVAMDMLKSKFPPVKVVPNIRNRPRIPLPDEDPYSVAGSGASSGSSVKDRKDKPPKLPPRDAPGGYPSRSNGKAEYDALDENAFRKIHSRNNNNNNKAKDRKYDDPYYCGLRARIPNFAQTKSKDKQEPLRAQYPVPAHPMWHTRSYDSGMDSDFTDSAYSRIYGRLPLPNRGYLPPPPPHPRAMYVGEWD